MAESTMGEKMIKWLVRQSMGEELAASSIYRIRAIQAMQSGDEKSADLFKHIADEEDGHYIDFRMRLVELDPEILYPTVSI